MTCETCKWWTDAGLVAQTKSSVLHGSTKGSLVELGYCEVPARDHVPPTPPVNHGLTASDYSCGEHIPKVESDD